MSRRCRTTVKNKKQKKQYDACIARTVEVDNTRRWEASRQTLACSSFTSEGGLILLLFYLSQDGSDGGHERWSARSHSRAVGRNLVNGPSCFSGQDVRYHSSLYTLPCGENQTKQTDEQKATIAVLMTTVVGPGTHKNKGYRCQY